MAAKVHMWLYLWMFISTELLHEINTQEYLVANKDDELLYTTSKVFPRQISVLNSTAQVGVVVDSQGERVAILNGETVEGVVIDKRLRMGVQVKNGGWSLYRSSFQDYLEDANITDLVEQNSDNVFELDEETISSEATVLAQQTLKQLSPDFLAEILEDAEDLFGETLKVFGFIIHPLKFVLGHLLEMATPAWIVFKGGFMALLNIFKWMGKLVGHVIGGLPYLLRHSVVFSLTAIITAIDGAKAFFLMLREIAMHINIMDVLHVILTSPERIVTFIIGLGGLALNGITGLFRILAQLFTFSIYSVASAIKSLTEMILIFLRGDRPSYETVTDSVDELLSIREQQDSRYRSGPRFAEYGSFLEAVKGEGEYTIQGINVGLFVKAITKSVSSAKAVVVEVMKALDPLIPFKLSLPTLLVNLVKSLNTTNGPSYVEQLIPSIKIPIEGLQEVNKNIHGRILRSGYYSDDASDELRHLAAPQLLKELPVVGQIYNELNEVAQTYENRSLDSLLESHHTDELVEFTTKAFGLV